MNRQGFQGRLVQAIRVMVMAATLVFHLAGSAAPTQVDVSGQVTVTKSGLVYNRATGTFDSAVTLTNSLMPITGPVRLILPSTTPSSVTLGNATGITEEFQSYLDVDVPGGTLAPGQSIKAVLKFKNPQRVSFSFTTQVLGEIEAGQGSNSITAAIDSEGGVIELPGVARLSIPTRPNQSVAIELSVVDLPQLDGILENEPDYADPGLPRLKIKLSAYLEGPLDLKIPLPTALQNVSAAAQLRFFAVEPYPEGDGEGPAWTLHGINGRLCDEGSAFCATLERGLFLPVPSDPADPLIEIVLLSKVGSALASSPIKFITPVSGSVSPSTVDITSPTTFKATFEIKRNIPKLRFPTTPATILSAFKERRQYSDGRPHTGLDISVYQESVVAALDGVAEHAGTLPGGEKCELVTGNIQHVELRHDLAGGSLFTRYLHLEPTSFNDGVPYPVHAGDAIGTSGTSGACKIKQCTLTNAEGKCTQAPPAYHLHFDVMPWDKVYIDPRPLLPDVNDTSLYLLLHDNGSIETRDTGTPEPYLRLRVVDDPNLFELQHVGQLDNQPVKDFATSVITYVGGEGQTGTVTPLIGPKTVNTQLENLTEADGSKYARISYESRPVTLGPLLQQQATKTGKTLDEVVATSKVVLELCTFRLGAECTQIAEWELKVAASIEGQPLIKISPNELFAGYSYTTHFSWITLPSIPGPYDCYWHHEMYGLGELKYANCSGSPWGYLSGKPSASSMSSNMSVRVVKQSDGTPVGSATTSMTVNPSGFTSDAQCSFTWGNDPITNSYIFSDVISGTAYMPVDGIAQGGHFTITSCGAWRQSIDGQGHITCHRDIGMPASSSISATSTHGLDVSFSWRFFGSWWNQRYTSSQCSVSHM